MLLNCASLHQAEREGAAMRNSTASLVSLLAAMLGTTASVKVNISNINYRHNTTGQVMDAHDGSYNRWSPSGPWYYYAMGYGTCKQGQDIHVPPLRVWLFLDRCMEERHHG